MLRKNRIPFFSAIAAVVVISIALWYSVDRLQDGSAPTFDAERAYLDVQHQVSLGPRTPGSEAHKQVVSWIQAELTESQWEASVQEVIYGGQCIQNVIGKRGIGRPWIILGAHYDSRLLADQDPDPAKQTQPVPGANDGASGVAILLELARNLPPELDKQVWLVFFDAEDNGNIPGYDWIMGSRAFVEQLEEKPDQVIIVDMVGDADLNLYYERNSDPDITREIWELASGLGYGDKFIPSPKHSMIDDHKPFLEAGIAAVDIIDFDYPYWHTTADTADKVSPESLQAVGHTLLEWLIRLD